MDERATEHAERADPGAALQVKEPGAVGLGTAEEPVAVVTRDARPPELSDRMAAMLRALVAAQGRRRAAARAEERLTRQLLQTMQERGLSLFWDVETAAQAVVSRSPVSWHDFGRVPDRWWLWGRQVPGLLRLDLSVLDALASGHEGVRAFRQSVLPGPGPARLIVEQWPTRRGGARR